MKPAVLKLTLSVLPGEFAIARLDRASALPAWAFASSIFSVTRTDDELSIVCLDTHVPPDVQADRGWRALRVDGPLDLSLVGVSASLFGPLARAGISVFALSTHDTDYVLVRGRQLSEAVAVLRRQHAVRELG